MRATAQRRGGARLRRYEDFFDEDFFAAFFFADFFAVERFGEDFLGAVLRVDERFGADFLDDDFFVDFLDEDFFAGFLDDDFFADFFADFFVDAFFFERFGFGGAFAPARRASERPIAIACLRLVTFLPERPLRSFPSFRSSITFLTFACAFLPYFAMSFLRFSSWTCFATSFPGMRARAGCGRPPRPENVILQAARGCSQSAQPPNDGRTAPTAPGIVASARQSGRSHAASIIAREAGAPSRVLR